MEKLVGEEFVNTDGTMIHISEIKKARIVLILFGAVWCPPCQGFKPAFEKFYAEANKNCGEQRMVEVIMVPCEDEEDAYQDHMKETPWPTIPYGDKRIQELQDKFEVDSIPIVMLAKRDGTIGTDTVKLMIQTKGTGCIPELFKILGE